MTRALAVAVVILLVIAGSAMSAEANSPDDSYAVQDGDTLLAIASKIGIPNDQLLDWVSSTVVLNGLKDADHLKSGQLLKLPPSSSKTATNGVNGTYMSIAGVIEPLIAIDIEPPFAG